jgi:hypothetical protein
MRSDMKRILGDHRGSRLAGAWKGKRFSPAEFRKVDWDLDDAAFVAGNVGHALETSLIGVRSRTGRGIKSQLMARFLSGQVGRKWNDVLSEIRAELRDTEIAEAHWPHLVTRWVAIRATVVDGEILCQNWWGQISPLSDEAAPKFYVDPRCGRLHRNTSIITYRMKQRRAAAAKAAELATRMRPLSPTCQLHRLADGNWWEVKLLDWDRVQSRDRPQVKDVVFAAGLSQLSRDVLYGRPWALATAKRLLSSREIKRYGLR